MTASFQMLLLGWVYSEDHHYRVNRHRFGCPPHLVRQAGRVPLGQSQTKLRYGNHRRNLKAPLVRGKWPKDSVPRK